MKKNHVAYQRRNQRNFAGFELLESRRLLSGATDHMPHAAHVTATSIVTSHDVVPRFVAEPTDLAVRSGNWTDPAVWQDGTVPTTLDLVRVPAHVTVQFDTATQIDSLEIEGTLQFDTSRDTSLTVTTITILPTGSLTIGTEEAPVTAPHHAELVFRDAPLRTGTNSQPGFDPSQYGNGLLVFGNFETNGQDKTPFVRATGDILRGDATIELQSVPGDWQVGDVLLLPKTSQDPIRRQKVEIDETETVTIAAIEEGRVRLETPTLFDHKGVAENSFDISVFAHVSNLTRNIVVRSENPAGVRGHILATANAEVSVHDTHILSMGRTRSDVQLDSTTTDKATGALYIGTNQIARYPLHLHHLQNAFALVGNVVQDNLKWGVAVHDTDNGLIQGNIIYDTDGAGVMTESGTETGNQFLDNLVVKVDGGPFDGRGGVTQIVDRFGTVIVQTGTDGSGFWFRSGGSAGITEGNAVYDAAGYAYNFNGYYERTLLNTVTSFSGNEAASSKGGFWLSWSQGLVGILDNYRPQTFENLLVWHSQEGVHAFHDGKYVIRDFTVIGNASVSSSNEGSPFILEARTSIGFVLANPTYENYDTVFERVRVAGQNIGFGQPVHAGPAGTTLRDSVFANYINLLFRSESDQSQLIAQNVSYLPSPVTKVSDSFPVTAANRFALDTRFIEVGKMSSALPPVTTLPPSTQIKNRVLLIAGSASDEHIVLNESGSMLLLDSLGQRFSFSRNLVSSYMFLGEAGNDYFENRSSLPGLAKGGPGNDTLLGGPARDLLYGEIGNDLIDGGQGDDFLSGGDGDDNIRGGDGQDQIEAGSGNDTVDGGPGNDAFIDGGAGNDVLFGGSGNDLLIGGDGDDQIDGGDGDDQIFGRAGDDRITGGAGADFLSGEHGHDHILGGTGDDRLEGGAGNDYLDGGDGDESVIDGGAGDDWLIGGAGRDLIIGGSGNDRIFSNGDPDTDIVIGAAGDWFFIDWFSFDLDFRTSQKDRLTHN